MPSNVVHLLLINLCKKGTHSCAHRATSREVRMDDSRSVLAAFYFHSVKWHAKSCPPVIRSPMMHVNATCKQPQRSEQKGSIHRGLLPESEVAQVEHFRDGG